MTEQEHLKRVLADLRTKEKAALIRASEQRIKAETYAEAADVIEIELTRFPKASTQPVVPPGPFANLPSAQ